MGKNAWPALRSCKIHKSESGREEEEEDNETLSELPDDVLVSIMSSFTVKEAAITSVLSHKLKRNLWHNFSGIFNFQDPRTLAERYSKDRDRAQANYEYTCNFVTRVTRVVEQHVGPLLEDFKVYIHIDNTYQSHIDKWVAFALAKSKSLVLNFSNSYHYYTLPDKCFSQSKSRCLKTLILEFINVTTEALDCCLRSCPLLETLHIRGSVGLVSIRASCFPLALKNFHVFYCHKLKNIDILAPNLLTFIYNGPSIELHIRKALLLSEVSIGGEKCNDPLAYAFDPLSGYFPGLEYLNLRASMITGMNLVIPPVSNLTSLKHLRLTILAHRGQSLLGWITLIEASPLLQKLTLEFSVITGDYSGVLEKRISPEPLGHLKTLELTGFSGFRIDFEMAAYVLENAPDLEEVIIGFKSYLGISSCPIRLRKRAIDLTKELPPTVKIVINE